jgi:hypothetical protein
MALKIRATYETEVYTTEGGYVAIKQLDPMGGDDSTVLLSAEQLGVLISELQTLLATREDWEGALAERTDDAAEASAV